MRNYSCSSAHHRTSIMIDRTSPAYHVVYISCSFVDLMFVCVEEKFSMNSMGNCSFLFLDRVHSLGVWEVIAEQARPVSFLLGRKRSYTRG